MVPCTFCMQVWYLKFVFFLHYKQEIQFQLECYLPGRHSVADGSNQH